MPFATTNHVTYKNKDFPCREIESALDEPTGDDGFVGIHKIVYEEDE